MRDDEGTVATWTTERAIVRGLAGAAQGELTDLAGAGPALITALYRDHVEVAPLTTTAAAPGARVVLRGDLGVPVGDAMRGRTIDVLGQPHDGGPPILATTVRSIFDRERQAPTPPSRRLTLGTLCHDLQGRLRVGASVLGSGNLEMLARLARHQQHEGRCVVWARMTRTARAVAGATVIVPPEDATAAARWLVPWVAIAVAADLRERGEDVVVFVDDLDRWREALVSTAIGGSWATQVEQLASRAFAATRGSVSVIARAATFELARLIEFDAVLDLDQLSRGELITPRTTLLRSPIAVPDRRTLARAVRDPGRARAALAVDTFDSAEQVACLLVACELEIATPGEFMPAYLACLRGELRTRMAQVRAARRLTEADQETLLAAARALLAR